ncbi:tyrosine-type recombinase/integrase [Bacillus thuringiensis serovar sumiyoshiensis]|uniref:tyrosine-type recombinase/integrase n=1 Tax=Bacillus thuringiensis TaxID=1428 RepID=UPI000A3937EB|nr:tyrosine-type recombinase/integrase [Bacillus thuringiensis]OTW88941.1 integrase [Bacillus thuringiensis serovar sumiyoshiensis]
MPLKKKKRITKIANAGKKYPQLTLQQALDIVISGKRAEGCRDRTLRDYTKMWGYFTDWLLDNYEVEYIDELTIETFRNYINYMKYDKKRYEGHKFIDADKQGIGLCDTTININIRTLRALLNHLYREELIEINPIEKIKLLRQDIDLTNSFTDEEIKEILRQPNLRDFVGFRDFVGINVLLDSGLRIQELMGLRAADIDFKTRFITIQSDKSKNRKPRLVPVSTHVTKLLLQLINENQAHFKTERIFLSSYGEPLGANHFNKRLKYYAEKAGIKDKKVTAHVYRHTWAKNMILNGCDAFTLQKIGGWSDIRTMRRYIQMDVEEMRKSHDEYSPLTKLRRIR